MLASLGLEGALEVYALTRMPKEVAQETSLEGWAKTQIWGTRWTKGETKNGPSSLLHITGTGVLSGAPKVKNLT